MRFSFGINFPSSKRRGGGPAPVADYIIMDDTDWTDMIALGGATLSGKTAEIRGALGLTVVPTLTLSSPLTVNGGVGGSIDGLRYEGDAGMIEWNDIQFQSTVWEAGSVIRFYSGLIEGPIFRRCLIRHGYGASLVNTPVGDRASIPEIQKPTASGTANTSSARTALTAWIDSAVAGGMVNFTNSGGQTIYAKLGDGTVTASVADTAIAAGASHSFSNLSLPLPTHIAVITASGSSGWSATREQGLVLFQKSGATVAGATFVTGPEFYDCDFEDLSSACRISSLAVVDGCRFKRIHEDCIAGFLQDGSGDPTYITRNTAEVSWAQDGDAMDPHGDFYQIGASGVQSDPVENIIAVGNVQTPNAVAADTGQGVFWSDWDINPNYRKCVAVANIISAAPNHAIRIGEAAAGFYAQDAFVAANTTLGSATNINATGGYIRIECDAFYGAAWGNIAGVIVTGAGAQVYGNLDLTAVAPDRTTVFPNFDDLATATTRVEALAALAPAGVGAGLGADIDAIDWTTTDLASVVKWQNLPSGAHWSDIPEQAVSTLVSTPLARVLNRRAAQVVTPGAGVEWRSVDTDGTTEVQAWTTSGGTIEPFQYIQKRGTTSALEDTDTTFAMTINGFASDTIVRTAIAGSSYFVGQKVVKYAPLSLIGAQTIDLTGLTNGLDTQPREDDLVVIFIANVSSTDRRTTLAVSGYTNVAELWANSTRDANCGVYYKVMGETPDTTASVTLSGSTSNPSIVTIQVFRGFDTTTPMDVTATTASGTGSADPNPAAITPTTTGAIIVVAACATTSDGVVIEDELITASYLGDTSEDVGSNVAVPWGISSIMGSVEWTGGAYDPAVMVCDATNSGNSWATITMALRPA